MSKNARRPTVEAAGPKRRLTYTLVGHFDKDCSLGDALEVLREINDKAREMGAVDSFTAEVEGGALDVEEFT